jgi:hypothetical protein
MFDALTHLLLAVLGLTVFCGTMSLIISIVLNDRTRLERLLDLFIQVFAAGADAIIGALKIFRRKDHPSPNLPFDDHNKLPPPGSQGA